MGELTKEIPKPLLVINGKNLIAWKLDALPSEITEVLIVVSHKAEVIRTVFGETYTAPSGVKKITFVEQGEPRGTADALWAAQKYITDPFISMMGDDIYNSSDIQNIVNEPGWAMTTTHAQSFPHVLDVVADENGFLKEVFYDTEGNRGDILLDVCLYKFTPDVFKAPLVKLETKDEYGLPQSVISYALSQKIPVKVLQATQWIKVNSPADIEGAKGMLS